MMRSVKMTSTSPFNHPLGNSTSSTRLSTMSAGCTTGQPFCDLATGKLRWIDDEHGCADVCGYHQTMERRQLFYCGDDITERSSGRLSSCFYHVLVAGAEDHNKRSSLSCRSFRDPGCRLEACKNRTGVFAGSDELPLDLNAQPKHSHIRKDLKLISIHSPSTSEPRPLNV